LKGAFTVVKQKANTSYMNQYDNENHAIAQLGLQLVKDDNEQETPPPSDEELAALCDNRLESCRRHQILDLIANDNKVYSRWMELIESLAVTNIDKKDRSNSGLYGLKEWWRGILNLSPILGSGLATAAVVVVAFLLIPSQKQIDVSDELNGFYKEFGNKILLSSQKYEISTNEFLPERSFSFSTEQAEYVRIIQTGFLVGAENIAKEEYTKWGYLPAKFKIVKSSDLAKHSREDFELLVEFGRLAALIAIPCSTSDYSLLINKVYPTVNLLIEKLELINNNTLSAMAHKFHSTNGNVKAVCGLELDIKQLINQ